MTVLVFHPNRRISNLFASNVHLYTNQAVIEHNDFEEAISEIRKNKNIKRFITVFKDDFFETDYYKQSKKHLNALDQIFLIHTTEKLENSSKELENISVFEADETEQISPQQVLKHVIRTIAQGLNITSKEMANAQVEDYCQFEKTLLTVGDIYRVDLHICYDDNFQIAVAGGEKFEMNSIKEDVFFIQSTDRLKFLEHATQCILDELSTSGHDLGSEIEKISQGYNLLNMINAMEINADTKKLTEKTMKTMLVTLSEDKAVKSLLANLLSNKSSYRYVKDMISLHIGSHIIDSAEWGDKELRESLAYLAIFSDISLVQDDMARYNTGEDLLNSCLSSDLKNLIMHHAADSAQIIAKYDIFPSRLEGLIKAHHGSPTGVGFNLNAAALTPINLIFMMAEEYARKIIEASEMGQDLNKDEVVSLLKQKYSENGRFLKYLQAVEKL